MIIIAMIGILTGTKIMNPRFSRHRRDAGSEMAKAARGPVTPRGNRATSRLRRYM